MSALFPSGIVITAVESNSLLHLLLDPEQKILDELLAKAARLKEELIKEWRPRLHADSSVTELPANSDDLATLILARSDYRTRVQKDAVTSEPTSTLQKDKYDAVSRSGSTVTLFASGITLVDLSANCILAYTQDLSEWVYGAVLGHINRGKKKMIGKYEPIIRADPAVTTMPATEDGLITMIVARSDYQRLGG